MKNTSKAIAALVSVMLAATAAASPAPLPRCAPLVMMLDRLADDYNEIPIGAGAQRDGSQIMLTVAPGGSWSILQRFPNNMTCVLAVGDRWSTTVSAAGGGWFIGGG